MNARRQAMATLAFAALAAGSALAAPLRAAHQSVLPARIGFLNFAPNNLHLTVEPFREGMRELGHVEGKTFVLEIGNADGKVERFPDLAAGMVRQKVDVIVASSTEGIFAAQRATTSIPVVFGGSGDPVGRRLVKSLARPGGNLTGTSIMYPELLAKQVELLKNIAPTVAQVTILFPSGLSIVPLYLEPIDAAAKQLGIKSVRTRQLVVGTADAIENAFAEMRRDGTEGVIIFAHPIFFTRAKLLADLGMKHRLPTISTYPENVKAGGLMSYSASIRESFKRTAFYVDKILKGSKPADLPVQQPTTFHLAVNANTAKALGLKLPLDLMLRANEVIE